MALNKINWNEEKKEIILFIIIVFLLSLLC